MSALVHEAFQIGNALVDRHKLDWHADRVKIWQADPMACYPIYVEISPAGSCNHRCTFCAVDYIGYKRQFLATDILADRLAEMGERGVRSIMYAGEGEPLLHPQMAGIVHATKRAGIDVSFTTNAVGLNRRFVDSALPDIRWIKASIDAGTSETHSRIHQCPDTHFAKLVKNLAYAVEVRNRESITCSIGGQLLLGKQNLNEVLLLAHILRDIGADLFVVKPYSQHYSSANQEQGYLEGLDYSQYFWLGDELEKLRTPQFTPVFRRATMESYVDPDRHYDRCRATPNFWAYIMASGDVYSCSAYLLNEQFRLGNINTQTFPEIWEGEKRREHLRWVENELDISQCRKNCRMHQVNQRLHQVHTGQVNLQDLTMPAAPYNVNFI